MRGAKNVGGFTLGRAHALWCTEEGGSAHLTDEGLRYKNTALINLTPTTLRLFQQLGRTGMEVVAFRMDIDDIGCIAIYRNMITECSYREIINAELHKRVDRKNGLSNPTDEQRELLHTEMRRGATGLYPLTRGLDPRG